MRDLEPRCAPEVRWRAQQFFKNKGHDLQELCELIGLDFRAVQEAVERQYPDL
jgi:hypothetical protein